MQAPPPLRTEPATMRVYERLRRQLGAAVGVGGFHALASRALALAKSESPRLNAVKVAENGGLIGLGEFESATETDEDREVGIILIAQMLGLFLTFLGEATTLRLIEDLRLQVDAGPESAATTIGSVTSAADGPEMTAAFKDLLLEIDRLRSVSEHIEALVDKTPRNGRWTRERCRKHSQYRFCLRRLHSHPKQGRRLPGRPA